MSIFLTRRLSSVQNWLSRLFFSFVFASMLPAQRLTVVLFPPLTKRSGINLHNTVLYQTLCSDKLVVGSVENDVDNTGFPGDRFRTPRKISCIKTESALFNVSSTDTDSMNTLGSNLGVGWLTTEFKLSFLAIVSSLCSRVRVFMSTVTTDSYKS